MPSTVKMRFSLRFVLVFCIVFAAIQSEVECRRRLKANRVKRRIDEFGHMIVLSTDRSPLDFNGYGNWCGFGGSGEAVDEIDRCCMVHDNCYTHVNRNECKALLKNKVYTKEYHWSVKDGVISCQNDDFCGKTICECDRAAAMCFGENNHAYNEANKRSGILMSSISKVLSMNWN